MTGFNKLTPTNHRELIIDIFTNTILKNMILDRLSFERDLQSHCLKYVRYHKQFLEENVSTKIEKESNHY